MKYNGGCHCGAVKYEVELDLQSVTDCNCSYCAPRGILMAFAPSANFKLHSGEQSLTEYRFNTHRLQHLFCSKCGINSFGRAPKPDGSEVVYINARCLEGVDAGQLPVNHHDGRSQ